MEIKMPVGIEDFKKLRDGQYYFVDKTDFIRQLIDDHSDVTLITRPRRFGKTLTMSMLDWFFSIEKEAQSKELFQGLSIEKAGARYMKYRGQFPVLFISLKDIQDVSWENMLSTFRTQISDWYNEYDYLLLSNKISPALKKRFEQLLSQTANQSEMANSLKLLMTMMQKHYGKPVILLLDEYDAPIERAWEYDFYDDCIVFMRQFLGRALKTNNALDFAILTGVLRVSKESIFSGLNNIDVCSVIDPVYEKVMGFTQKEVEQIAQDMQMEKQLPALKYWYDGYHFGKTEIYNPWSILNFFKRREIGPYWVNTSGNGIIRHILSHLDSEKVDTLLSLLHGNSIMTAIREGVIYADIDRDEDTLYTLLLTTGYLTMKNKSFGLSGLTGELAIPNREIRTIFRMEILDRFNAGLSVTRLEAMLEDLLNGRVKEFSKRLSTYIRYLVSSYDSANKESFYHGFLLGMSALLMPEYVIESNRESGYGRFDLAIYPKNHKKAGVILEFKASTTESELESKAKEARQQIDDREYITEFEKRGIKQVWKYGIAFCGKKICVVS